MLIDLVLHIIANILCIDYGHPGSSCRLLIEHAAPEKEDGDALILFSLLSMTSASINDIDPDIEISPVTVDVDVDHVHDHQPTKPHITPLPKIQLAVLLTLFLAEPITSTVIYPFINQAGYPSHPCI